MQMIRAADEAPGLVKSDDDEPRGVLRVSCSTSFADLYLSDIIADFVKRYPAVVVDLSVSNTMVDLVGESVDLAIRVATKLQSSSLVARRLASTPKVLCASPAYLEAHGTPRTPDDLRAHACLRFSPLHPEIEWRFRSGRAEIVVPVSGPIVTDNVETLRRAAVAGAGIVALPVFCLAPDLAAGRLVRLLEEHPLAPVGVFAVYAKGRFVPAKVRKFIDHLASRMRKFSGGARTLIPA
jgi:DNA-binding transcriptional LysR family regulator